MEFLKSSENKKINQELEKNFGINKIPYLLLRFGKEKIRLYSGSLSKTELFKLDKNLRVESAGLYFLKEHQDGIRFNLDSIYLFKDSINKNIIELDDKQASEWLNGFDLNIKSSIGYVILKNNEYFIGCGKSTGEKIVNSIPKERRIRN
ncbi:MAG: methyltransferase RsmF C-terminal domain-like protein [Candidatus Nanoarchaeia archaeon]